MGLKERNKLEQGDNKIKKPPKGKEMLFWLGPSFLWMLSAAGSGELLFTPRIAALYGYTLLWALLAAVTMKWFINREVGRFTVCTGKTVIDGYRKLPGPKNWALWLILIPQLAVAVATVAGMAGAAATALSLITGGAAKWFTVAIILVTAGIILLGQYKLIDKTASYLAVIISLSVLTAAFSVSPALGEMGAGLAPQLPDNVKFDEVLPWLGFMLAGAAGLIWYSYWIQARGFGASVQEKGEDKTETSDKEAGIDPAKLDEGQKENLKGWLNFMTLSNTLAVVGALLIAMAFLILGTELLKPEGLVPEENKIAGILARLLGDVWGSFGYWFMVGAIFITFCSTTLSVQDGFGRMFSEGTSFLLRDAGIKNKWADKKRLQKIFVIILLGVLPVAVYLLAGEPVGLLKTAGAIEAAHIPVVTALTLFLNKKLLPKDFHPSKFTFIATALAGLFFTVFAVIYLLQLTGMMGG